MITAVLAVPAIYLAAALLGSLIPVDRDWSEAGEGTTVYLADNGIHVDVVMPVKAQGLDWRPLFPKSHFAAAPPQAQWISFGTGERRVYLETPTWWDIRPRTVWSALSGGQRVMHVEYVPRPYYTVRQIRLRPEEYRRLWAAIRADFVLGDAGKPRRVDHPGYDCCDAFYEATGRSNAFKTCNVSVARWLRLAGIRTSLWTPFAQGLVWRYRRTPTSSVSS